ncbi:hypothetical protein [Bradyrhizobium sp. UFLA05-112]
MSVFLHKTRCVVHYDHRQGEQIITFGPNWLESKRNLAAFEEIACSEGGEKIGD